MKIFSVPSKTNVQPSLSGGEPTGPPLKNACRNVLETWNIRTTLVGSSIVQEIRMEEDEEEVQRRPDEL